MKVDLIDHMGSDLRIVQAAKVSIGRNRQVEWARTKLSLLGEPIYELKPADRGVVKYMLENRHGTPFEHVLFTFYIQTNIGVMREAQRHRIASWNELSTRYAMMKREFDFPALEDMRTQVGKPGHYTYKPIYPLTSKIMLEQIEMQCLSAFDRYEELINAGLAKEVARGVLPLFLSTEAYFTINLRSLFNFLGLRLHTTALKEIQLLSKGLLDLTRSKVPETLELWEGMGRPIGDEFHDCDACCDYHLELDNAAS